MLLLNKFQSNYCLAYVYIKIYGYFINIPEWKIFNNANANTGSCSIKVDCMSDYTYRLCSKEVDRYFTISYGNFNYKFNSEIYNMCIPELFQNRIIHLHSSYIIYHDKAILFTGPSGIGKTTQAELWRDYQGAEIINGDVTLIRKWDGRYCAFGAPIHGSSPYCENKSAPIEALIVLQQGTENQIEVLNHFEALSHCLPEIYRPEMPEETQNILWETIDDFFSEMPVYRLTCRPDRESTDIVKEFLGLS